MPPATISAVLALLLLGAASSALAQKTYRCGNTYQSFPCAGNDAKGGTVKSTDSGTSGAAAKSGTTAGKSATGGVGVTAGAAPAVQTEEQKKLAAAKAAEEAEAKKKAAVAADKKSKCDKINNDINYNTAQLRSGGSQTTQDRLNAERRKLNSELGPAGC